MPKEIRLPVVATDFESGSIEEWLKSVGDKVEAGESLLEVSTDKAVVEVEAEVSGTLGKILVEAGGADIEVNTPIAIMLLDGEDESALENWDPAADDSQAATSKSAVESEARHKAPAAATVAPGGTSISGRRLYASPIARRIASRAGIDLEGIPGSGPKGRVVLGDVEAVAAKLGIELVAPAMRAATLPAVTSSPDGVKVEPAGKVRKIIAERLTEAKRDIPHFYLTVDFRLDRLLDVRQQLNDPKSPDQNVSVNDFFVKACALALLDVPGINASWTGDGIAYFDDVNISVAVSSPMGLMTPVLRDADKKSLATISAEMKDLAGRAREGKLKPEEFKDGGFTISNLGMYGIREFSAIINPPQACILAIGKGEKRPIVRDGEITIATMASCTLSVDHRAVDGSLGAEYLQALKKYIEHPARLVA